MRALVIIAVALLLAAAAWGSWRWHAFNDSKIPHPANLEDFESDMTESLARNIFAELQKDHQQTFFLAFGDRLTSPSPEFMSRFQDVQPRVRRFESVVTPPNGMVIDASNGNTGAIVQIIKIKPVIDNEFDVEVATSNSGWKHFIYRISKLGGEWRVKSSKPA